MNAKDKNAKRKSISDEVGKASKKKKVEKEEAHVSDNEEDSDEEREEGGTEIAGVWIPPAPPAYCSLEASGPRLVITHITNENFKSYQGRVILGPFHKSFTSIIGPNGSGKSNVIDSMLFVFGYRATKIRSKKLSVLIHKSEFHQNIRSCTVAVHFALINDLPESNPDFEVVPNSEFVVARTAFADNSSKYTINGKTKTFKDVTSLLLSRGIDLKHNRFLILQGEVEQIAMMKSKGQNEHETGMLEYLEDIIGTVRYKKPIEKLKVKYDAADEERKEKLSRLKMVEKDKDSLKDPLRDAIEYLRKDNRRIVNYNKLYQLLEHQCNTDVNIKESEKKQVDEQIEQLNNKLKEMKSSTSSIEKELNGRQKELEMMVNQRANLNDKFSKSEKKNTELREAISHNNKRKKKDAESLRQDEAKIIELKKVPEKNKKDIAELEVRKVELAKNQKEASEYVKVISAQVAEQTKPFQAEREKLVNEHMGLKLVRDNHKEALNLAKGELELYINTEKKETDKLNQMQETAQTTASKLQQLSKDVGDLERKIPSCEREIGTVKLELQKVKVEETKAVQEYNAVLSELQDKRHSAQSNKSRNQVLQFIMKQKETNSIPGIIGRLGDLGGIDGKYDVAVSTACSTLDHIVVQTGVSGKACVNALKKFDVGRAKFINLEQVAWLKKEYSKPILTPENVPRLFDLIQCSNENYKSAFYFGLRDTLVAKDLEQARRVAYGRQRFRVVTLAGEIIEIAGTMSGGGKTVFQGRMGRNPTIVEVNPAQMEALEQRSKELSGTVSGYKDQRIKLEETLNTRTRQLETMKDQYQISSRNLKLLKKEENESKQRIAVQEKKVSESVTDPAKVKEMEENVKQLTKALEKATADTDKLESQLKEVDDEITKISGDKVKTAQKKHDNIKKQLERVTKEISSLNVGITTSQREIKKAENRIQGYTEEIKLAEEMLTGFKSEMEKLIEDSSKINEDVEDLTNKIAESKTLINDLTKQKSSIVKEEEKIKVEKLKIKEVLSGYQKDVQQLRDKINSLQSKIKGLVLHEVPSEEDEENQDDVRKEEPETLKKYSEDEIASFSYEVLKYKGTQFDEELKKLKFNPQIIKDYQEKVVLYKKRLAELDEVTSRRNEIRNGLEEVSKARLNEFMTGFQIISNKLKEMYQMITFGGDAEFELADNLDPFSEGVIFSVRPPRKSWKVISNLSGGEKTLSSLALVFALHYYKPSPLYVMDEIDAALDFKNVSIVAHYIKQRTRNAQFIIISLRSNMFELADVLVGIYKTYNCTKSVTVTPKLYGTQLEE